MTSKDEPLTINTTESTNYNLSPRFTSIHPLGYGSSGLVLSAHDEETNRKVAIKRVAILDNATSKQALREVKFMKKLLHDNIVPIYELLGPECDVLDIEKVDLTKIQFVYIVEECLDTDLQNLIRGRHLDENYARWFIYQLLRGLKYIHSANLIHRDLKPNNLLVNCSELVLKISDFGLCRVLDPKYDHKGFLTENVGSCWYRSPEEILSPSSYDSAIDMWSAGCVFAEMLSGGPLLTGANELSQMILILDTIHLDEEDWDKVLQVMPNKLLKNHPFRPRTPLGEKFTQVDPQALDLLECLLTFDPEKRYTAEQALAHPYLAQYSCQELEPTADTPFHIEHEVDEILSSNQEHQQTSTTTETLHQGLHEHQSSSLHRSPPPVTTSQPPISSTPPPAILLDETHTLDEILNLSEEERDSHTGSIITSHSHRSSGSNSVEDLNMRNLAQSQENLSKTPSSQNILSLSDEHIMNNHQQMPYNRRTDYGSSNRIIEAHTYTSDCMIIEDTDAYQTEYEMYMHENIMRNNDQNDALSRQNIVNNETNISSQESVSNESGDNSEEKVANSRNFAKIPDQQTKLLKEDEDEKDIAEISVEKKAEDEEIETETSVEDKVKSESSISYYTELRVNIEDTENYKETSQVESSKEMNNPSQGDNITAANQSAKPKNNTQSYLNNITETSEESIKERKLLEFYRNKNRLSKFEAENRENEKCKKKRIKGNNRNGHNSDLDEMYRLPTEHLCMDRDYSNERIKQKQIAKIHRQQRQCLARYRDEINELNERLKEASLVGAVGGADPQEEGQTTDLYVTTNISISESVVEHPATTILNINRRNEVDIVNQQRAIGDRRIQNQDGFSSPEDLPSSPRASFSTGARPKKSPRKQKAL